MDSQHEGAVMISIIVGFSFSIFLLFVVAVPVANWLELPSIAAFLVKRRKVLTAVITLASLSSFFYHIGWHDVGSIATFASTVIFLVLLWKDFGHMLKR